MDQPIFYKNAGRLTAIYHDDYFVQYTMRNSVRTVSIGKNKLIVEETIETDMPCTENEFVQFSSESEKTMHSYIYI